MIAIVSLPIITNLAIAHYDQGDSVDLQFAKVVEVFAVVLVPVALGMLVKARRSAFADRMDRPVRTGSAIILAVLVLGILLDQRENVGDYLADVGLAAALFCAASLVIGYVVPRAAGIREEQAIASSMEIGVHNGTLAIYVAVEVLDSTEISVPAAVYSGLHVRLRRRLGRADQPADPSCCASRGASSSERLAPVRDGVLVRDGQLRGRHAGTVVGDEQHVVAEPAAPPHLADDGAVHPAVHDHLAAGMHERHRARRSGRRGARRARRPAGRAAAGCCGRRPSADPTSAPTARPASR